jgi:LPXTG-motif cell wall-anchored protein
LITSNSLGGIVFRNLIAKKFILALALLSGLGLTQLSVPAAVAAPPAGGYAVTAPYPPRAVTTTDLRLNKNRVRPGERNTAHARVRADTATPQGTVTFKVAGHQAKTVRLVGGKASYAMPRDLKAGKTYKVTARYNGKRFWKPSRDTAYVTVRKQARDEVRGSEGNRGDESRDGGSGSDNGGSANRTAPSQGEVQGAEGALPSVGADSSTTIIGLLGFGLLAAGGLALIVRRRRVH